MDLEEIWRWDKEDKEILGRKVSARSERESEAFDGHVALCLVQPILVSNISSKIFFS